MTDSQTPDPLASSERSRRRRNVVGRSPHREEYVRLMEAGWTSFALERYARYRYGDEIPASTFRTYKTKKGIVSSTSRMRGKDIDPDRTHDVVQVRQELIALQMDRIAIDAGHEREMNKLFGTTSREIKLLSELLDASKADLQDLGVFPKAATEIDVQTRPGPAGKDAPRVPSLAEVVGGDALSAAALARQLHEVIPLRIVPGSPNGLE